MRAHKFLIISYIIIFALAFRAILGSSSMAQGDAPYLTQNLLKVYFHEPYAWTTIGTVLGGVNQFLWIWPYMALVSFAGIVGSLSPALLTRLFFFIPSIVLAAWGSYQFASRFTNTTRVKILTSLIYTANTYFLLVLDGGQVGISLAYGLFPVALTIFAKAIDSDGRKSFLLYLVGLELITLADPRVAIICLVFSVLLFGRKIKNISYAIPVWLGINMYWLYPLLSGGGTGFTSKLDQFSSLLNGLFFYAPHWSKNIYGVTTYPSVLFAIFPISILLSVYFGKLPKKFFIIWLLFVFLIKGTTPPLGMFYSFFTSLPFGTAFRDSTKFFIPALLLGAMLSAEGVSFAMKKIRFYEFAFVIILGLSLLPAIQGNLSFNLSGKDLDNSINEINRLTASDHRVVWVNERDPQSSVVAPTALNGSDLVKLRPFASLNVGDHDALNFLNATESAQWVRLFGINHFVLNGNPRLKDLKESEAKDWVQTQKVFSENRYLTKEDNLPVYLVSDPYPLFWGVDKMLFVIGSDDVYGKINKRYPNALPERAAVSFVEDGKFSMKETIEYASTSAAIIDNGGGELALTMSLLQKSFLQTSNATRNDFAQFQSVDYLKYKYELLVRNVVFNDFDYNLGISFSSKPNEHLVFNIDSAAGEYVVAIRSMTTGKSVISTFGREQESSPSGQFVWTKIPVKSTGKKESIDIQNKDGVTIVNTVAIVPKLEFEKAQEQSKALMQHFPVYTPDKVPKDLFVNGRLPLELTENGTTRWSVERNPNAHWLVQSYQYSPEFTLSKDTLVYKSIPAYSSINSFYMRPEWQTVTLSYQGQTKVRWGIYYSVLTLLLVAIYVVFSSIHEK